MNKTILLAASFMLALGFTVSCSDDKNDENGGGSSGSNSGSSSPSKSKEYCEMDWGGPKSCLEMPKSECSGDFYKNNGYNDEMFQKGNYKVVNECKSESVVCWVNQADHGCGLLGGNKSLCEKIKDGNKGFSTIKECLDYDKSYVPPTPTGPLCLYTSGGKRLCTRFDNENGCLISVRGEIVEVCPE